MLKSGPCAHCGIAMAAPIHFQNLGNCSPDLWKVEYWVCPGCDQSTIELVHFKRNMTGTGPDAFSTLDRQRVHPKSTGRPPVPPEVPVDIAKDYMAAAAMARRCLQSVIRKAAGIQKRSLHLEIDELLKAGTLPAYLADQVDAIRHLGNFGAHPEEFQNTGQLVPVEHDEVEWTLELLESLFDFYYVMPAKAEQRKAGLNAKLDSLNKRQLNQP